MVATHQHERRSTPQTARRLPHRRSLWACAANAALALCALSFGLHASQSPGVVELLNVNSAGVQGNSQSERPCISGDGRLVAFYSVADNLVPGDNNGIPDFFVRDRITKITQRVSVNDQGQEADDWGVFLAISRRGRCVAFESFATNLVPGDLNGKLDIFIRDLGLQRTTRVSLSSLGAEANGRSEKPALSGDGRFVVFTSAATNLVPGDTNNRQDVFVHDRLLGITELVSISTAGGQGNHDSTKATISDDGRYCAFQSRATNLDPALTPPAAGTIYLRDRVLLTTRMLALSPSGQPASGGVQRPLVSGSGTHVAFMTHAWNIVPGDTNSTTDVFVTDLLSGITERVSLGPGSTQLEADCYLGSISFDGRFVGMISPSSLLIPGGSNGKYQAYARDRSSGQNYLMSQSLTGQHGLDDSFEVVTSDDGRFAAFESDATNLFPGDTNPARDLFLADVAGGTIFTYCTAKQNSLGCVPALRTSGFPGSTTTTGFVVHGENIRNQTVGLLLYGFAGSAAIPFQGGFLCVQPPVRRMLQASSGGSPVGAHDCSGHWSIDVNAFSSGLLGGSPAPALRQPGVTVDCQWWGRDPGFPTPFNTALTAALEFVVLP